MISIKQNNQWEKAEIENFGTSNYHAEVSLSNDEKQIWFTVGDRTKEQMIFMTSQKNKNALWGPAHFFHGTAF